jgi:hypothetical protein
MKVHNLSIDSSQRQTDEYTKPNDYVITLKNPIYDVTEIKLVSARIPTPQLTVCDTNNTFSVDDVEFTLASTNYSNGHVLAEDLETILAPPESNVSLVVFDEETNTLNFSNVGASNAFTFEFQTGTNGFVDGTSAFTTPHQVIGFGSNDYTSTDGVLVSGAVNFAGPNSLVMKLTAGSDEFTQSVYTSTPFYTGHILLDGSDAIHFTGGDDPFVHRFHSGPQKYIKDLRVEFFYMSHGRLIPYDFMNQDHILKFEITCSTDKLDGLPKLKLDEVFPEKKKPIINIPELKNGYNWEVITYIGIILALGLLLITFMKKRI